MKIYKNKILFKLIASLCVFLALFNFLLTDNTVYATNNEDDDEEVWGGVLLKPVMQLLTGIGDGVIDILHSAILEQDETLIRLDGSAGTWWDQHGGSVLGWLVGIAIAAFMVASIFTGGLSAVAGVGLAKALTGVCFVIWTSAKAVAVGTLAGMAVAKVVDSSKMSNDIYLPVFKLTPEEIFANKVWLFDVNFFNPNDSYTLEKKFVAQENGGEMEYELNHYYTDSTMVWKKYYSHNSDEPILPKVGNELKDEVYEGYSPKGLRDKVEDDCQNGGYVVDMLYASFNAADEVNEGNKINRQDTTTDKYSMKLTLGVKNAESGALGGGRLQLVSEGEVKYEIVLSCMESPALPKPYSTTIRLYKGYYYNGNEPISQKIVGPNVSTKTETQEVEKESVASQLRGVISQWYFILRNLAILVLMVVLIYSGIRIVIGSTAGEKAKYKERIMDWLVALCLVFVMHYIMAFAVEITEKITELVETVNGTDGVVRFIHLTNQNHKKRATEDAELSQYIVTAAELDPGNGSDQDLFIKWGTDLMGGMRLDQQMVNEGTANWLGYGICYLVLVMYTFFFAFTYLKRVLYMAFLTIVAPLVAMTYPIDKITDGKAQAFNAWLKEYIFNLLIQPFHLLLYTVLVSAAYQLAAENALYAIVAIGFMIPAEKLLRKFFGFDKAQTPGLLGGAAGAALAMTGMKKFMGLGNKHHDHSGKEDSEGEEQNKIKYSSSGGVNARRAIAGETEIPEGDEESEVPVSTPSSTTAPRTTSVPNVAPVPTPASASASSSASGATPVSVPITTSGFSGSSTPRKIKAPTKKSNAFVRGMKTIGSGIGAYNRALGRKNYKRIQKGRPIRALARGAAGLFGGAALAMAGLALGVASGDPSKAFQYGVAGATGGYNAGKGVAGAVVDEMTVDGKKVQDEMELAWYGEEYKKAKLEQEKKMMERNEQYIDYLRKTMSVSRREAREILRTTGATCYDSGVTDIEDIAAVDQMSSEIIEEQIEQMERMRIQEGKTFTEEQKKAERRKMREEALEHTIAMKKYSDRAPNFSKLGENKREEHRKQFRAELQEEIRGRLKKQGMSDAEAEAKSQQMADDASRSIVSGIIRFDDTKSDILRA